ncbi:response regulator [Kordia jejudonensis]|uniref:response regulator n=1 Tax=Kordia jejudonensis TaxID=1348245 RepID=UPI0006290F8A|nr:response regulator transcription factor [Kordia jejudonensis]
MNTKIIIADDHPMLLKGLHEELLAHDYNVVAAAKNGAEALESIVKNEADIAILDIEMPILNGFEVIKKSKELSLKTKFILLTSHKEARFIYKAKNLNISGYLLKDEAFEEIKKCIEAVENGETYFSATFNNIFDTKISPELKKLQFLSPSERTIIRLIAQGKSSSEISETLLISVRTVQKHRANILSKLDIPSSSDALTVWVQQHLELVLSL